MDRNVTIRNRFVFDTSKVGGYARYVEILCGSAFKCFEQSNEFIWTVPFAIEWLWESNFDGLCCIIDFKFQSGAGAGAVLVPLSISIWLSPILNANPSETIFIDPLSMLPLSLE